MRLSLYSLRHPRRPARLACKWLVIGQHGRGYARLFGLRPSTGVTTARAGLTKALCRSADAVDQPNVLMLLAHLATTQTQLTELPPAVLEVCTSGLQTTAPPASEC